MWAGANEDQCCWWLGTTTCTQIAVDAVTPFNSLQPAPPPPTQPPFVSEELLASRHPSFVLSLISRLFSASSWLLFFFHFCLFSLQFGQWVEFAVLFYVCAAITELLFFQIVMHIFYIAVYIYLSQFCLFWLILFSPSLSLSFFPRLCHSVKMLHNGDIKYWFC